MLAIPARIPAGFPSRKVWADHLDSPVSEGLIRGCQVLDGADQAKGLIVPPERRVARVRVREKASSVVSRMARAMVEIAQLRDSCRDADLFGCGFLPADISVHGPAAQARAAQLAMQS